MKTLWVVQSLADFKGIYSIPSSSFLHFPNAHLPENMLMVSFPPLFTIVKSSAKGSTNTIIPTRTTWGKGGAVKRLVLPLKTKEFRINNNNRYPS